MSQKQADAIAAAYQTLMRGIGQPDLAEMSMDEGAFGLNDENRFLFGLVIEMGNKWEQAMGYE